jgi:DNA-binding response OmpR family regulator
MVVEDEDGVRDFVDRALGRLGYHVTAVSSGEEAMARVGGYFAEPIDLLITDVVLPGMSGPELAAELSGSHPQMPVLYVSGYASDVTAFHGLSGLAAHVLAKPFGMDALVRRVRAILDERPGAGNLPSPEAGHKWGLQAAPETETELVTADVLAGTQPAGTGASIGDQAAASADLEARPDD